LTLAGVRRMILQDLDGHHFVGALLPAFHHLLNQNKHVAIVNLQP
jgi:hypothetical protein